MSQIRIKFALLLLRSLLFNFLASYLKNCTFIYIFSFWKYYERITFYVISVRMASVLVGTANVSSISCTLRPRGRPWIFQIFQVLIRNIKCMYDKNWRLVNVRPRTVRWRFHIASRIVSIAFKHVCSSRVHLNRKKVKIWVDAENVEIYIEIKKWKNTCPCSNPSTTYKTHVKINAHEWRGWNADGFSQPQAEFLNRAIKHAHI